MADCDPLELVAFVESIVPKSFNPHIRDDLLQDILVAVVSGELKVEQIAGSLQKYARDLYRMFPVLDGPQSMDTPIPAPNGEGRQTVSDTVADEGLLADAIMIEAEDDPDEFSEYISNLHALEIGSGVGRFTGRSKERGSQ
jgi:hypothetical protein